MKPDIQPATPCLRPLLVAALLTALLSFRALGAEQPPAHEHASPSTNTPPSSTKQSQPDVRDHSVHAAQSLAEFYETPKDWPKPVKNVLYPFVLFDQLEYRLNDGQDTMRWDLTGWYGGDYNKFWFKSEGEQETSGRAAGEIENQFLYSRLITPFWDAQVGVRYDASWGPDSNPSRTFAVIGLEGFAPYRFEVEPALFISEDGDVSAKFTASADLFLTQRLILQPRVDTELAVQEVSRFGVGEGFNNVELGLRLRYEFRHEFAPYIGVHWRRLLGETASFARNAGEDVSTFGVVFGVRLWF